MGRLRVFERRIVDWGLLMMQSFGGGVADGHMPIRHVARRFVATTCYLAGSWYASPGKRGR